MQEPAVIPFGMPEKDGYILIWARKDKVNDLVNEPIDKDIKLMPWACEVAGCSAPTLKKKLFRYRDVLDMDNGGCVRYSTGSGSPWKFSAPEFRDFVSKHKKEFMKSEEL